MRNASESSPTIITLVNPSADELGELRDRFDLHPLIVDDLRTGRQQPKFERPGHRLYLSLWDINERSDDGESDLAMIFDEHLLLIVQRGPKKVLRDVRSALSSSGIVPVTSTISAVFRVLETIVSDLVEIGSAIERELDEVEEEVFDSRIHEDYRRIYHLRGRIGRIDRAASGMADAIRAAHGEIQAITDPQPELRPYFEHLEHDVIGVAHLAAAEHKALDAVVSSHESNVSTRQNQDMRTISAYAALLAIPTVIAGVYGMNFKNLPMLEWEFGWLAVGVGMLALDTITYMLFRHRGWLGGQPSTRRDGEPAD